MFPVFIPAGWDPSECLLLEKFVLGLFATVDPVWLACCSIPDDRVLSYVPSVTDDCCSFPPKATAATLSPSPPLSLGFKKMLSEVRRLDEDLDVDGVKGAFICFC